MRYVTTISDQEYFVEILEDGNVLLDGKIYTVDFDSMSDQPVYSLIIDGQSFEAYVYQVEDFLQILMQGRFYPAKVEDEREKRLRMAAGNSRVSSKEFHLKAPMPGLVVALPVEEGQSVKQGDVLVILESMKMQNELKSPREGTVSRVRIKAGDSVEARQTMLSVI